MDTRTFYDRISGVYDLLADASEGACRDQGLRMLNVASGDRVLEIGFGTGHALAALAAGVGPAGSVVGIDVSSGMRTVAQRIVEHANRSNVAVILNDARSMCFQDAVFDAAFLSFTLELFDPSDITIVLAEIRRVLRPGGRLAVVAMATSEHSNVMIDLYQWLHRHFPHFVDCRPIDLSQLLGAASFIRIEDVHMSVWGLSVGCAVTFKEEGASSQSKPTR
jgi:ubiquinone/menaquinone biosynthesis C-methylase UbiE